MARTRPPSALERTLELFAPAARPEAPDAAAGYVDLLGREDPTGAHPGQRLMASRALPLIYERLWRPLGGRLFMGLLGPGMQGEQRLALELLALEPGDRVLDVGCGPGNFTRTFAQAVGPDGLAVGLDASATMLGQAVQEGGGANIAYVRGDASALPFGDGAFDAVCCFAALYFIHDPHRAIAEIARVLAPGGRVAILTSVNRGLLPTPVTDALLRRMTGVRIFGREEVTGELRAHGLRIGRQRVTGMAQFVGARSGA